MPPRQRREMFELLTRGRASRTELVEFTATRRNTLYDDIAALLEQGFVRQTDPDLRGSGRPRIPLEVDPLTRHIIGVNFQPGRVEIARCNLLGDPIGPAETCATPRGRAISSAVKLIEQKLDKRTAAIGVAIPGFVDRLREQVVFSMAFPNETAVSLKPIRELAGDIPVVIETEAHAVAARWLLTHARAPMEDTLLIYFGDGSLGSAFIVRGRPNRGCISGANEIGHTQLNVHTATCYCGGVGCLERICDTHDLHAHKLPVTLTEALAANSLDHPAMVRMVNLLATGFANAINFTRAGHVIIASLLPHSEAIIERLVRTTRQRMLPQLQNRVRFDPWPQVRTRSARTAAHLARTALFYEDW